MAYKAHQLILHFGLPKTGTSAIQRTLFDKRNELLEHHNTLYPGIYENHFYFQGLFSKQPESLFQIQMLGLGSNKAIADFLDGYRKDVLTEIDKTKPRQIIISSEYFRDMSDDELMAMRKFFETIAKSITLFAYVRDPWSWCLSSLQEQILTGYRKKEARAMYLFSLRKMLGKFEGAFGTHAVIAPYVNKQPDDFNVAVDFCQRFNLTSLIPAARKNTNIRSGMKREAACVMLQLNQVHPVFDDNNNFIPDSVRDLMRDIIRHSPLSKTPLYISKSTAKEIYENSKADIQLLEEQYFSGKRPFTEHYNMLQTIDSDDTLSIFTFNPEQLSEYLLTCMHILGERVIEKQEIILDLENKLIEVKNSNTILEHELSEIKYSKAWKILLFFRRIRNILTLT